MKRSRWLWVIILVATAAFVAPIVLPFVAPDLVVRVEMDRRRGQAGWKLHRGEVGDHTWVWLDRDVGVPVVLVHGFGAHKDHWDLFARHLPGVWRGVAVDLPGWGESTRLPDARYDVPAQAERLRVFLHAQDLVPAHLVGNSMGAAIAARLAADHPEDVRTLTLISPAWVPDDAPSFVERERAQGREPLLVDSHEDFSRLMELAFVEPPFLPPPILASQAKQSIANRPFAERVLAQLREEGDAAVPWERIEVPTLVIWGTEDKITDPSGAAVLDARIPDSTVLLMPATGHAAMLERPETTARDWADFALDRADAPGARRATRFPTVAAPTATGPEAPPETAE